VQDFIAYHFKKLKVKKILFAGSVRILACLKRMSAKKSWQSKLNLSNGFYAARQAT